MVDDFDILIKNGLVADGSGSRPCQCDIGVKGNKITALGDINYRNSGTVLDAAGLVVSPGFIDIHSHSDFFWLLHPECNSKIFDGVTTEICGNCGSSPFPIRNQLLEHRKKGFEKFGLEINWQTAEDFFNLAETKPSSINRGFLVGHGNLRACNMGYDDRLAGKKELAGMKAELSQALALGAFGMSSGIAYPPGCYASVNEITELCHVVNEFGAVYTTHIRDEGDMLEESLLEAIRTASETGVKLQISHLKTAGKTNWHKLANIKKLLDSALSEGVKLTCDRYPYTASSTDLDAIFPKWIYEGGVEKELERLKDNSIRKKIRKELNDNNNIGEEFWQSIVISSVFNNNNKGIEGKSIWCVASERKNDPFDTVCDLLIEEDARIDVLFFNMSEENLQQILKWNFVMFGSDSSIRSTGGILNTGKPHPRSYGTFSRILGRYGSEKGLFPLEEAIYKMSGFPAQKFNLENRGFIKCGYYADIVIFDKNTIKDMSEFQRPHQYSTGIKYVIVNGKISIENGIHTGATEGMILKRRD
ncbi:MAG: N-acyl-D-amino-acid deacylase family protein [Candidatus Anammoxibacter sp.]